MCRALWKIPTLTSIFLPLRGVPTHRTFRGTAILPGSKYPLGSGLTLSHLVPFSTTSSEDAFVVFTFEVGVHFIGSQVSLTN